MKKIIAAVTAGIIAFSATACQKSKSGATLDISLELSYISEQFDYHSKELYGEFCTENGAFLTYTDNGKNRQLHVLFLDAATEEFTEVQLHSEGKKHGTGHLFALPDGRFGVMFQNTSAGIRDWEYGEQDAYIDIYNSDLTYAESVPFSLDTDGTFGYDFCSVIQNGKTYYLYTYRPNGFFYSFNGDNQNENFMEIMVLDEQMAFVDAIHVQDSRAGILQGASGEVYVTIPLNGYNTSYSYSRVNLEQMQLEPLDVTIDKRFCGSGFATGTNGYEFYSYGEHGLCGVTFNGTTGESEQLMDFRNSNFLSGNWIYAYPLPDGRFIIKESNVQSQNLWLCRKRTEEEMKNVQVITMAGVGFNEQLEEVVNRFNRNHPEYRIMMVDYMQYLETLSQEDFEDWWAFRDAEEDQVEQAANLFMQDLMNGIVPDIICTDNLPYVQLANKGIFLDMTELMEKDERFQEEDYVMSFFDSMKYKGQQQTIAFSFFINTVVGKKEYVGDKMGLTPDEYLAMIDGKPGKMEAFGYYPESYIENFLPWLQNSFLDTENAVCSFDSPAFAKLLEIGKESQYETAWLDEEYMGLLLTTTSFNQPIDYRRMYALQFEYEDMTLVGYPSTDGGNGCVFSAPYTVGINAMSKYQDVVWDIFMELLSEDTQRFLDAKTETYSFPVLRSALEEDITASTKGADRVDSMSYPPRTIGKNSEEDAALLRDYINNATMFYYVDPAIMDIISEEAGMYFAGDQTADEAAKMIQSRASLYISEQY